MTKNESIGFGLILLAVAIASLTFAILAGVAKDTPSACSCAANCCSLVLP